MATEPQNRKAVIRRLSWTTAAALILVGLLYLPLASRGISCVKVRHDRSIEQMTIVSDRVLVGRLSQTGMARPIALPFGAHDCEYISTPHAMQVDEYLKNKGRGRAVVWTEGGDFFGIRLDASTLRPPGRSALIFIDRRQTLLGPRDFISEVHPLDGRDAIELIFRVEQTTALSLEQKRALLASLRDEAAEEMLENDASILAGDRNDQ